MRRKERQPNEAGKGTHAKGEIIYTKMLPGTRHTTGDHSFTPSLTAPLRYEYMKAERGPDVLKMGLNPSVKNRCAEMPPPLPFHSAMQ